ncbi:MAG: N-acetyltransferase [Calditrichaeota bacterium]|nr:N-acetyltransferase [Calditrichota bacterium]HQU71183.1 N-acetyltransferase family protein [Calditrichia bacterium]
MEFVDREAVLDIYRQGIEERTATFETTVPEWADWFAKTLPACRLVAEQEGNLAGWAVAFPVSPRHCYRGVAEISIYVSRNFRGKRVATRLLDALIEASEAAGIWSLLSVVFPENTPTLRLHARSGFREIGRREKIAQLDGCWRDTVMLERRSKKI